MLKWSIFFFLVALAAGALGFGGVSHGAALIAQVLFYMALGLFLAFLAVGVLAAKAAKQKFQKLQQGGPPGRPHPEHGGTT